MYTNSSNPYKHSSRVELCTSFIKCSSPTVLCTQFGNRRVRLSDVIQESPCFDDFSGIRIGGVWASLSLNE